MRMVSLKNAFCFLALTAMLAISVLTTARTEANGAGCPSAFAPGAASSIDSQLEQTAAKLARIPANTYAKDCRMGNVMVETARLFLGIPYVSDTLEKDEESLVVKFDGFDCATFVDTVLALSRSRLLSREQAAIPGTFIGELRNIRYKNGRIDSFLDRLHYTTQWIAENERTGRVRDITAELGGSKRSIVFAQMSEGMKKDRRFADRPGLVARMQEYEAVLSKTPQCYIPADKIESILDKLRPGDIICFAAAMPDLDTVHVSVFAGLTPGCDVPTIIHASSKAKRVLVEPKGLVAYTRQRKNTLGIIVVRPMDCGD